jgi:signal transduction histidine kinase
MVGEHSPIRDAQPVRFRATVKGGPGIRRQLQRSWSVPFGAEGIMANRVDNAKEGSAKGGSVAPDVVPPQVEPASELEYRLRQQALLAELGRRALAGGNPDDLLQEATRLVALGLETSFCKILEYLPDKGTLLVRAGVGWGDHVVGVATVGADLNSPAGYALHTGKPTITNDLRAERRFRTPRLLQRYGIQRAINVILSTGGKSFGVLEADSQVGGTFTERDIDFLQAAANLLGVAIERHEDATALQQLNETLEQRVAAEVAERRQTEQALQAAQKMEAVGQLTGGVAHDFNNLLTVIRGNLQLVGAAVKGDERLERLIDAAEKGIERGEKLTSQLLAFARKQTLRPQLCNVNNLLKEFDILAGRMLGGGVELVIELDPAIWSCEIDSTQFTSALLNLVANAGDAMDTGGKVVIRTGNVIFDTGAVANAVDVKAGSYVMISVQDNGMTPDVLARAAEPFFTTKEVGKGTGLGLSQVYGFAKQSDGFLSIESEPGSGTTVSLYLPGADGDALQIETLSEETPVGGDETILIVEDDDGVRGVVVEALSSCGYRTREARSGAEALDVLKGEAIDLMLTDVIMPGISGAELMFEARRLRPDLKLLLTSGYSVAETAAVEMTENVPLLKKPYNLTELYRVVREVLSQQGR